MIVGFDENGNKVSSEDIEEMCEEIDRLDFSQFEDVSECVYGSIAPVSQEKETISFTLPVSVVSELNALSSKQGCSRSDVLRSFVFDGLLRSAV